MNGKRLQEIANDEALTTSTGKPLRWTKSHTIKERVKQIMAARSRHAVDTAVAAGSTPGEPKRPANPDFEKLCDSNAVSGISPSSQGDGQQAITDADAQAPDARGGVRPGAGRPQGMTEERSAVMKLPEVPNKTIKDSLEALFELWSQATKCPDVALTKDEATDLALHWTRLLHMVGVEQKIPDWISEVLGGLWDTYNMLKIKAATARQAAVTRAGASVPAVPQQVEVTRAIVLPVGS